MVKSIEDLAEFDELIGTAKKVIVDFTATWCGPCKMIGPIFVKLAETPGGLVSKAPKTPQNEASPY